METVATNYAHSDTSYICDELFFTFFVKNFAFPVFLLVAFLHSFCTANFSNLLRIEYLYYFLTLNRYHIWITSSNRSIQLTNNNSKSHSQLQVFHCNSMSLCPFSFHSLLTVDIDNWQLNFNWAYEVVVVAFTVRYCYSDIKKFSLLRANPIQPGVYSLCQVNRLILPFSLAAFLNFKVCV
jgi:hypothetical protein